MIILVCIYIIYVIHIYIYVCIYIYIYIYSFPPGQLRPSSHVGIPAPKQGIIRAVGHHVKANRQIRAALPGAMVRVTDEAGNELPQHDGDDEEEWWGKWRPWGQGESRPANSVRTWV